MAKAKKEKVLKPLVKKKKKFFQAMRTGQWADPPKGRKPSPVIYSGVD